MRKVRQANASARRQARPLHHLLRFSALPQPQTPSSNAGAAERRMSPSGSSPLDQWTGRFLLYLRAERSASAHTLRAYKHDLEGFAAFVKSRYPGGSLERHGRLIVRDYLSELHQKTLKRASILRAIAVLRAF